MRQRIHKCLVCGRQGRIGFFSFPKNVARRKIWIESLNLNAIKNISLTAKICMLHFNHEHVSISSNGRTILKRYAIPHVQVTTRTHRNHERNARNNDEPLWTIELNNDSADEGDEVRFISSSIPRCMEYIKIEDEEDENESSISGETPACISIDLTTRGDSNVQVLQHLDTVKNLCQKNLERISHLKQEKKQIKKKYENLLNALLEKNCISKEGRRIMKTF